MATASSLKPAEAIAAHHAEMVRELRARVDALIAAVALGDPSTDAAAAVGDYASSTLLPHAAAEENVMYPAAEKRERRLVQSLVGEHAVLRRLAQQLATAREGAERVAMASALVELFEVHASKENDYVLPTIVEDGGDLTTLLHGMHEAFESASAPANVVELDVRALAHAQRHEQIFGRLRELASGDALLIVNDHDPKPLRYQIDALWPAGFSWTYRESGPERWAVLIARR